MRHVFHRLLAQPRPWAAGGDIVLPAERYQVRAADGQILSLRRVRPPRLGQPRATVLLLHGLAANSRGFHLRDRSFARWLAEQGVDVWMPELRGHGDSRVEQFDWALDDYLNYDIPAIIEGIQRYGGADEIYWVGHSMGGILLLSYLGLNEDAPIVGGVTIGSALDYGVGHSGFSSLLALRPVLERMVAIPYGTLIHLLSPALGRGGPLQALAAFSVWPTNIEPELVRALHARCFHTIPISLLQSLATTFEPQGLRLQTGEQILEQVSRIDVPLHMLAGSQDAQVSVAAVKATANRVGDNATSRVFGSDYGQADEYGHWDLILGRRARAEVWPEIAAAILG